MTDPDFVIVPIMGGSDLYSSSAEFHVDDDGVRDNRESAIDERVDSEFSVKVLQRIQQATHREMHGYSLCTLGHRDVRQSRCRQA